MRVISLLLTQWVWRARRNHLGQVHQPAENTLQFKRQKPLQKLQSWRGTKSCCFTAWGQQGRRHICNYFPPVETCTSCAGLFPKCRIHLQNFRGEQQRAKLRKEKYYPHPRAKLMVYLVLAFIKRTHSLRPLLAFSNKSLLHHFWTLSLGSIILCFQHSLPASDPPRVPVSFMIHLEQWFFNLSYLIKYMSYLLKFCSIPTNIFSPIWQ